MYLYCWQPEDGDHGPLSFFVMEETVQDAKIAVKDYIRRYKISGYDSNDFPLKHELTIFSKGKVVINNND